MVSVATVACSSRLLEREVTFTALVPAVGAPPFAVLYLLHGYTDQHTAWLYKSSLVRLVEPLPLLVVLPAGENSWYCDGAHGPFERFLVEELPETVARLFRVRGDRAAIGGLSMGGFGAIRLGLKYPERYASIYAHSSRLPRRDELAQLPGTGSAPDLDDLDVAALATRARAPRAALAFDCGTEDHLLADSRRFHALLDATGIEHHYREASGGHTWDYWERQLPLALAHHARVLGLRSGG